MATALFVVMSAASCAACSNDSTAPGAAALTIPPATAVGCARYAIGETPLNDLQASYKGEPGGLYPGGLNAPPNAHAAAGTARAQAIGPLDASGNQSASGKYVFVSIGMSNTTQEFSAFKPLADADPLKDPKLVVVDGAQGGVTASQWASASCPCWSTLDSRLSAAGATPAQVATAWVKLANASPTAAYPAHAQALRDDTIATLKNLKARYPNVRLAYLSSRIYAGYATTTLNPEPYAYESAFAVRDVIATQLNGALNFDESLGAAVAPWVGWGPYLWADGLRPRSDGLTWACSDLQSDGTHPSASGTAKVAQMLLSFFKSDPIARLWFTT
jgi:lysophospholipase L1-like esterase